MRCAIWNCVVDSRLRENDEVVIDLHENCMNL
jgi:hypothetical protein